MSREKLNRLRDNGALLRSIIGRRTKLRKVGHQWKGCCPFHNDNTPSFFVYVGPNAHYHCYGCGAHGSVFDFLMAIESVGFAEAARRAAGEAGMW
jgi:DNA primase